MNNFFGILFFLTFLAASGQENTEIIIDTHYNGYFSLSHKKGLKIVLIERFDNDSVKIALLLEPPGEEKIIFDSIVSSPPGTDIAGCTKVIDVPDMKNVSSIIIEINNYPIVYVRVIPSKHYLCITKYDDVDEKYLHIGYQKYPPIFE